jgi:hypothetical protein
MNCFLVVDASSLFYFLYFRLVLKLIHIIIFIYLFFANIQAHFRRAHKLKKKKRKEE